MSTSHRFSISVIPWTRPLLVLFTATASRSWVELGAHGIDIRFGWYTSTVPYGSVKAGRSAHWPWYAGLGWRTNFRSVIGLIGAYHGVVEIELDPPHHTRLLGIGMNLRQLYISLDEQERFLRALEERVVAPSQPTAAE